MDSARQQEDESAALERRVLDIWKQVLGAEIVQKDDHFFDLGGNSVAATLIAIELTEALGIEVSPGDVYANPTVEHLAMSLAEKLAGSGSTPA